MAPSEGRQEVPDSEDEPMTSSPVAFMDGAGDKLSATARVPLQDAQDAPTEPALAHQATAGDHANMPGTRTDGLDVDQLNASSDVDVRDSDGTNTQPDTTAPEQAQLIEANVATHALNTQETLQLQPSAVDVPLQPHVLAQKMTASIQRGLQCEAEYTLDHPATDGDPLVDASNVDGVEQHEISEHTEDLTGDARHDLHPDGSDENSSGVQATTANGSWEEDIHLSDAKDAQLNADSTQIMEIIGHQAHDPNIHRDAEQAVRLQIVQIALRLLTNSLGPEY